MTKKKRVQVMLTQEIYDEVELISKLGGVSMGSLLAELLSDTKPALQMIREALEQAKKQDLSGALGRLQSGLLDASEETGTMAKDIDQLKQQLPK